MGSVKERERTRSNGTTYVVYRAQTHDPRQPPSAAKNIERTFSTLDDEHKGKRLAKAAALKWIAEQEDLAKAGEWRDTRSGTTVDAVAERWRKTWDDDKLAPKTQASYLSILSPALDGDNERGTARRQTKPINHYIVGRFGNRPIASITSDDVQAWLDDIRGSGAAPQSVHNAYTVMRGLMRYAMSKKLIARTANPCNADVISLPSKAGRSKMTFLEPDELHILIDHLPERWRTPVWLDALTGLRSGELWGLTFADIDPEHNEIVVQRAIKDVGGKLILGDTKTHAQRRLSIPDACLDELRAHLSAPGVYRRGIKPPSAPKSYTPLKGYAAVVADAKGIDTLATVEDADDPRRLVFVTRDGAPVSENNFLRVFHRAVLAAVDDGSLPKDKFVTTKDGKRKVKLRVHDLRHSSATFALQAAGNAESGLFVVQQRLGHKNIRTTADTYGHLTRAADKNIADGISAIVKRRTVV